MKNKGFQITIAFICLILGLMLAVQVKSIKKINSGGIDKMRASELQTALSSANEKLEDAKRELASKEKKIEQYQEAASKGGNLGKIIQKDITQAKLLAGLTAAQGPGVIITLNDSKVRNEQVDINENYFVIHDSDILLVINELRASGAEAISLNDQRVIATSEIRCAGPVLSINNTRTSAPFRIKAIGNATDMENALKMRDGVVDALQQWGIEIEISKQDNLVIPGFDGALTFKYAVPFKEGGNQ
ncbi:MAG: DUF881 domain-containing protein [Ignavibacteriales bacterium]